jgi:rhamnosyl/mannosyltransferase
MAAGCPVINTNIPHSGVTWVSQHEKTGLTVPIDDPQALASAAARVFSEPGLRERLSAAGVERVKSEFDHRVMASRTIKIYESVLSRRNT